MQLAGVPFVIDSGGEPGLDWTHVYLLGASTCTGRPLLSIALCGGGLLIGVDVT